MPARAHRTVDRVVQILEAAALSSRGVSLTELSTNLQAAKSSIQELTNGLIARGYLTEVDHRFHLGPGPFILASRANKMAAATIDHRFLTELSGMLSCDILLGVQVGDALIFVDHVGESPMMEFVTRQHARRPLHMSAAGKILLANLPQEEMNQILDLAGPEKWAEIQQFLLEVPSIRSQHVAYNRAATLDGVWAVAAPLRGADGEFIAAITASVTAKDADHLETVGEQLKQAISELGPSFGFTAP